MKNSEAAKVFKALSDERRIEILKILVHGERCACNLLDQFEITQPTLSHHLKILCDAGIIESKRDGKWMHYSISEEGSQMAKELLESLTSCDQDKHHTICSCGVVK